MKSMRFTLTSLLFASLVFVLASASHASELPIAEVTVSATSSNATISVTVSELGESATAADVYYAFAAHGEALPEATLATNDVTAGQTVSILLANLNKGASYDYAITVTNDFAKLCVLSGTFTTLTNPVFAVSAVGSGNSETFTVTFSNLGADSCDLYFAYALTNSALSAYEKIESGVSAGTSYEKVLSELTLAAGYQYSFKAVNSGELETVVNGTFTTPTNPVFTASAVGSGDCESFTETLTVNFSALGADSCDLYFAYAPDGSALNYEKIETGVATNTAYTKALADLTFGTTYNYSFKAVNSGGLETVVEGTFTTPTSSAFAVSAVGRGYSEALTVTFSSLGADSCDLYFAYAPDDGSDLPAYEKIESEVSTNTAYTKVLSGLTLDASYKYSFKAINSARFETVVSGTFRCEVPRPDPNVAEFARGLKFFVNGYTGTEVLTNFPVLVRLSESTINGFHYSDFTRADYKDLCFVDMQTNGLPCEVDTWNASGESLVWVTLPRVTNGTEFVMWYHSSSVGSLVCDKTAWGDYAGVWHMNDPGDGAVTVADATTNNLHATATSGSFAQSNGRIGGARIPTKDGSGKNTERIEVNLDTNAKKAVVNGVNTDADHAFTVSMWVKPLKYNSSFEGPNSAYLMSRKTQDKSSKYWAVQFHYDSGKKSVDYSWIRVWRNENEDTNVWKADFEDSIIPSSASFCYGNWYKFDVVYSNKSVDFYVNGGSASGSHLSDTSAAAVPANGSNKLFLTGTSVNNQARPFRGDLDEFRLRAGAMSADWVKADYDTVNNASFLTAGEIVTVKVKEIPVASFSLADSGAAFATFSGVISSLGEEEATSGNVYYKVWQSSDSEPISPDDGWTLLLSGLSANETFTKSVTGLTPGTAYSWKLYAKNDLGDSTEEVAEGSFTTSGAGIAGIGGETYRVQDDYVHRFTVGEDTASYEFTPPSYVTTLRALVVAGGGPGGYDRGGGGGAGGLVYNPALPLSGGTTYTINVGTGGVASASSTVYGSNGGDSAITNKTTGAEVLTVIGGGAGGNYAGTDGNVKRGMSGGSGGGSAVNSAGGAATGGQGCAGGNGMKHENFENGGGGGGAVEPGGNATSQGATFSAGGGGAGFYTDISGEYAYYAGGGGGGADVPAKNNKTGNGPGRGGDGGGGDGGSQTVAAMAGQDHLGGGGGGGYLGSVGGNGGSGVVILRYSVQGDGQGMTEPAIALESHSRDPQTGVTTVGYRVAWAGDGYDRADVAIVWGFRKDNLSNTNAIASSMIGRGTGTFTLPDQTRAVYMRALATNAVAGALSTEIVKVPFINPNAPVATVAATHGITTAGFEADVTSLGGSGATRVEGVFQVCEDEYFEDGTYLTFPVTNGTLTAVGVLKGAATGLSAHTTYFVRASLTNNFDAVLETEPFEFRTSQVDWPDGQIQPSNDSPSFTVTTNSISATFYFTDLGEGAASGSCWLEVSTTEDFATILASSTITNVVAADIPATCNFTVEGLQPDTAYYVRYRVRNNGGRETSNDKQWSFTTQSTAPAGAMFLIY